MYHSKETSVLSAGFLKQRTREQDCRNGESMRLSCGPGSFRELGVISWLKSSEDEKGEHIHQTWVSSTDNVFSISLACIHDAWLF